MRQFKRRSGFSLRTELSEVEFATMEGLESRVLLSASTPLPILTQPLNTTWQNAAITAQTTPFQVQVTATPTQNDENALFGLADGSANAYTDLAAIIRFNPTGQIDVRNGSTYQADNTVNYVAGMTYEFTMDVNPSTQTYSVYVTPAFGSEVELASNYAFRTEQATTTVLNDVAGYALAGSADVSGFSVAAVSLQTDGGGWDNSGLASQNDPFDISFDATPSQSDENAVIGLSDGPAGAYTDLAAIVRFNPTGQIDVRDGSNYQSDNTVNYVAGTTYQFTMDVDPTTQTYSVYVTPAGGSQVELASNYAFRTEQATTSTLNNLGGCALVGAAPVTDVSITSATSSTPTTPVTPTTPTTPSTPTTPAPSVLGAPSNLTASAASSSEIDLTWTDNSGGSEQGFNVLRSTNGGSYTQVATVGSGVISYSDTGLTASSSYSYEVEAFTSSQASGASNSASATTDTAVSTPVSSGTAGPTAMPGPSNTGPQSGTSLTPYYGIVNTTSDGQVIQNLAIQPGNGNAFGQINVYNNNVTIVNCTINGGDAGVAGGAAWLVKIMPGVTGTVIENCSMTATGDGEVCVTVCGDNTTISNCQFYNTAGSVFMLDASNITVKNNWLYEIGWDTAGTVNNGSVGDFHTDDVFLESGTGYVIENNVFDTPWQTTINGVNYGDTTDFFIDPFASGDVVGTVAIQNNYLAGGGSYMFYFMGQGTVTFANNEIASGWHDGIVYSGYVGDPIIWANNVLQPSGTALSAPVVSGNNLVTQPQ